MHAGNNMSLNDKFNVPNDNDLTKISYKVKGTMDQNEYWTYHEQDSQGQLVSIIEYWECTSLKPPFKLSSGYRKYDPEGNEIEEQFF